MREGIIAIAWRPGKIPLRNESPSFIAFQLETCDYMGGGNIHGILVIVPGILSLEALFLRILVRRKAFDGHFTGMSIKILDTPEFVLIVSLCEPSIRTCVSADAFPAL